jgi:predicted small lipoprotein YifL
MTQRLSILAASLLLLVVSLTGCGTPGAPQLPSLQLARPVDDLTASRKGAKIQLDWTLPRKNIDRTLVKNIPESRICRHDGTALMSGCTVVANAQNPKPEEKHKHDQPPAVHMKYVDTLPAQLGEQNPAGFVRYAVEIMNSRERSAGLSNQVLIPVAPTIAPPEQLAVKVEADGVLISWVGATVPTAPTGLTYRYRVMRSPAGANAYIALADIEPASEGFYLDKTFGWETKYDYRIESVTLVHSQTINMSVEGDDSKATEIFTRDIYPPAEPTGLQAVFSSVGQMPFVDLTWAPNMESDLAGYNVFRRVAGGDAVKLNKLLVPVPSFRDDNVVPGKTYLYSVSAVDARGNESPHSAETTEPVPAKQ